MAKSIHPFLSSTAAKYQKDQVQGSQFQEERNDTVYLAE